MALPLRDLPERDLRCGSLGDRLEDSEGGRRRGEKTGHPQLPVPYGVRGRLISAEVVIEAEQTKTEIHRVGPDPRLVTRYLDPQPVEADDPEDESHEGEPPYDGPLMPPQTGPQAPGLALQETAPTTSLGASSFKRTSSSQAYPQRGNGHHPRSLY